MYKDILLPVDLNDAHAAAVALPAALELCRTFDATLHVMAVMPSFELPMLAQYFPQGYEHHLRDEFVRHLHEFTARHVPPSVKVQSIVGQGRVHQEIVRIAAEIGADLIVMGSHRPELRDYLIGPNAEKVLSRAHCSVLVVRQPAGPAGTGENPP